MNTSRITLTSSKTLDKIGQKLSGEPTTLSPQKELKEIIHRLRTLEGQVNTILHDVRDVKSGLLGEKKTRESLLGLGFALETIVVVVEGVVMYYMRKQRRHIENIAREQPINHESNHAFDNENLLDA